MLRIDQLRLLPDESEDVLLHKCARLLRVAPSALTGLTVLRRAIDARESLTFVYTVAVSAPQEAALLRRCRDKRVTAYTPEQYALPAPVSPPEVRPIVVGAGPAGLFAALVLAKCGARPILLERGQCVEQRQRDVQRFWATGELDTESNVQFGEGGAGAFSDGKLNTGTRDLRHRFIMEQLVSCGAPESILTDALPHVGTDKLHIALQALRRQLLALGADIRFGARLEGLTVQDDALTAVTVRQGEQLYTLPPGRSCWRWVTAPVIPSRCCTTRVLPWSRSPSPWGCASSTGSRRWMPPATEGWRVTPPCLLPPTSCPATCPTDAAPFPSASAPAGRWWPPRRKRGAWSPTA